MPELWPPPESEVAQAETTLSQFPVFLSDIEEALDRAKAHWADLNRDAPHLRELLTSAEFEQDRPRLADLKAAQELRADLVRTAQLSVAASQAASRYLQAREKFLQSRHAWTARAKP